MALLSIILPSYNEEANIANTAARLKEVLEGADIPYELLFVSDGSRDNTFGEIQKLSTEDHCVRGIEFSRNFGKEAAIFAGLQLAEGSCCVVMDCDLQHPPEVIPEMYRLWRQGYDIVEGVKSDRGQESGLHRFFANAFYGLMSRIMKMDMRDTSDFKLLDRKVMEVLTGLTERNTFFRALTFWAGFSSVSVSYEVQKRTLGESKWSFMGLIKYAVSNTTSFTTAPLQLVTVAGIVFILASLILGAQTLFNYFTHNAVEGFTTVILLILIVGGLLMLSMGVIGHYIARIYEEVKGRPRYIIAKDTLKEEQLHEKKTE
ncbi:MAG: glycosyltransferase family 2 protein [Lachnospiraceae bacterium]|nr:glycosyltransferase family 2 protein [Lachnospiraceae bacterium]